MYLSRRRPKRRVALIVGVIASIATLFVVFGYALLQEPERLIASLALPELITRTPTLIGDTAPTEPRPPTATHVPTSTRTPTPTATPMATVAPSKTPRPLVEHFILGRPILDGTAEFPNRFYLYGTTGRGDFEVHHGQDFTEPFGIPVVAAANGTVVVAGNDELPQCGAGGNELCGRYPDFYGNVIIVKLDESYQGLPVYIAYGHVQQVYVRPGQHVQEGEPLGEVGQEGFAVGPHLHFEVRLGANSYATTRNPILWMRPLPGTGALAGRLQDRNGNAIRAQSILIYADDIDGTYIGDTETYAHDSAPVVNSDDVLQENWAFSDLPEGSYIVRAYVGALQYSRRVFIRAGELTFITFGG